MRELKVGIRKFRKEVFARQRELFQKLREGQSPQAAFVSCSDSRVIPNLITQTNPGDIFVIRNAGNLIPNYSPVATAEGASLQYAVEVLRVPDIIVCGHSLCGAMAHLISGAAPNDRLSLVNQWLHHAHETREVVDHSYGHLNSADKLNVAIQENVLTQITHLRTYPFIEEALQRGTLRLHGWVYKIETGNTFEYDAETEQFVAIDQSPDTGSNLVERIRRRG